jgi:hypothetical protein
LLGLPKQNRDKEHRYDPKEANKKSIIDINAGGQTTLAMRDQNNLLSVYQVAVT